MRQNYSRALALVLKWEGGFSNHPDDPGGATNRGITQAVYDAYRRRLGLSTRSVKLLADDAMRDIYRKQYWLAVHGDELPGGLDYAAFDFAVNSGPGRAIKYLQMVLGVTADGVIGQITLRAAEESDPAVVIAGLCDRRLFFLKNLSTWASFGKGWKNRVDDVRRNALTLAKDAVPASPVPDTTPKPDLPPAVTPEPSLWTRFVNWLGFKR